MRIRKLLIALCLFASPVLGENGAVETAQSWFINARTPNWRCEVAPGKPALSNCFAATPGAYGFAAVHALKVRKVVNGVLTDRLYTYIDKWGGTGPGEECFGDDILLFEAPWTHAGVRGNSDVIYRGMIKNCDGQHWSAGNAFKDVSQNAIFITSRHSPDGETFTDLMYGRSPTLPSGEDDGINFQWNVLLRTTRPGLKILDANMLPHPTNAGTWWGFLTFQYPPSGFYRQAAPMTVNLNTGTISVQTSANGWTTVPIGADLGSTITPYGTINSGIASLSAARGRYEVWAMAPLAPGVRGGLTPCTNNQPTATYTCNTDPINCPNSVSAQGDRKRGANGTDLEYWVVTPTFAVTGPKSFASQLPLRPNPSDYAITNYSPFRIDVPLDSYGLYTASADNTICDFGLAEIRAWSGMGISFSRLSDQ